jgi:D-Tyr-tRNAtyr deacylase
VSWVVGVVCGVAALIAVAVLGVFAFDTAGKAKRLARDATQLRILHDTVAGLQASLADTQRQLPTRPGGP